MGFCLFIQIFLSSIIYDLKGIRWYTCIALILFGALMIIFSVIDFNSLIYPERNLDLLKWNNDEALGFAYWRRVLMALSGAASFTGAMSVVLTTLGKLSSYFWGIINCILYGLFAFAYGYGGDAQLNIIFYLPMQFWGIYTWKDKLDEADNRVESRSMKFLQWVFFIVFCGGITVGFYYEIPKFVEAIEGTYFFYDNEKARILDAATNGLSITANILLIYRFWEQWIFWIAVDCLQIAMYAGIAGFGIDFNILFMWSLFLVNALFGLFVWLKREKTIVGKMRKAMYSSAENLPLTDNKVELRKYEYNLGLIINDFYPLHKEYNNMINNKLEKCGEMIIVIYDEEERAKLTKTWLAKIHKDESKLIEILILKYDISDKINISNNLFHLITPFFEKYNKSLDVIFCEEDLSDKLSHFTEKSAIPVTIKGLELKHLNINKHQNKISLRPENLIFFHPVVRDYYVPRIVLIGPESTGKTTMAKKLAEFYNTNWVKEIGRDVSEDKLKEGGSSVAKKNENGEIEVEYTWTDQDFFYIEKEQNKLESLLVKSSNLILICDTDSFATNVWYERYMNKRNKDLEAIHNEHCKKNELTIYFLFSPKGAPFVQDGTRDGIHVRDWMHKTFVERLKEYKKMFFEVEGNYQEIENQIKDKIKELLGL